MFKLTEVAARLNCSLANVYALKDAGLLVCVATGANGKGLRVEEEELERFLRERRERPGRTVRESPRRNAPRAFKHLDGDRLLAAWRRRGSPADRQDADSARS